jgi:hypothetical protein
LQEILDAGGNASFDVLVDFLARHGGDLCYTTTVCQKRSGWRDPVLLLGRALSFGIHSAMPDLPLEPPYLQAGAPEAFFILERFLGNEQIAFTCIISLTLLFAFLQQFSLTSCSCPFRHLLFPSLSLLLWPDARTD